MRYLIILPMLVLAGCMSQDSQALFSTVRSKPMGQSQYMITCVDSPMYCANEANKLCQNYQVVSNTSDAGNYGRTTMIIKCN